MPATPALGRERALLFASAGIIFLATAAGALLAWRNGTELNHVSGAWLGLALDLAHGTFYRPLFGEAGYGGTRFMPLYFTLHAGLIRLFGHPLAAGYALSLLSVAALLAGAFTLLRRVGLAPLEATTSSALLLVGASTRSNIGAIRGDVLPLAFAVWGLALLAQGRGRPSRIPLAAALFALALASKLSALNGLAAGAGWLWLGRDRKELRRLLLVFGAVAGAVAAAVELASRGRFLPIFLACASGGGRWTAWLLAPVRLLRLLATQDPAGLALVAAACVLLASRGPRRQVSALPALFWSASLLMTLFILGSPGTGANHLVDLEVASALVLGSGLFGPRPASPRLAGALSMALAGCTALSMALRVREAERVRPRGAEIASVLEAAGKLDRPLLSEDPLVPALAGQRPYVLDPFMLRVARERLPGLAEPLLEGLREGSFGAVVLLRPLAPDPLRWYALEHFGPGFAEAVGAHYALSARAGRYYVYLPRTEERLP